MTSTRRLAAIVVADVVGFSRLMAADEAGTLAALLERRKTILEPLVKANGGRIVKVMGDGVLVEFASAVKAVEAGLALQERFAAANGELPEDKRIWLRIGINLGEVVGEGSDIYGDGVNIAARLEALAEPGGICISAKVHDEVNGKVGGSFVDLGPQRLRNIDTPVRVYGVRDGVTATSDFGRPALTLPDKPSIAAMPFHNLSGDPEQDYFADGIVEEIITALSRFHGLFVIARNSSFIYKGKAVDVKQAGRELGVRYILEGSVRKAAGRLRISGQLIDAATGAHLWADRFDGGLEDIFDLQDQVTAKVVGAIAPKLEQAEIERTRLKPTESYSAYDCYLRGTVGLHQWSRAANDDALSNLYRAIEIDPGYATAYGLAARVYVQRNSGGWIVDPVREFEETERLARRAVDLGPDDAVALSNAAFALADMCKDAQSGIAHIDKALELNPSLATAWLHSGWIRASVGQSDTALDHLARMRRLSPHDPMAYSMYGATSLAYFVSGRYLEGFASGEAAMRSKPDYLLGLCLTAANGTHASREAEARKAVAHALRLYPHLRISSIVTLQHFYREDDAARWLDGLRKAGLPE
jgi:adenylate cyclase